MVVLGRGAGRSNAGYVANKKRRIAEGKERDIYGKDLNSASLSPREKVDRTIAAARGDGTGVTKKVLSTGEDVTGMDSKAIEEKILINKEVEKARFNAKVKSAIAADTTQEQTPEETSLLEQMREPILQEEPELQDLTKTANIKSAIPGFAVEAAPTVLGAAATGAAAGAIGGSVVVPGVGTAVGAVVGGSAGALSGLLYKAINNVKAEAKEDTLSTKANFDAANTNIGSVIQALNRGYISQEDAVRLYRKQLAIIDRSERQLKELTDNELNEFLSGGSTEMAKIAAFNSPGGEREFWDLRMQAALLKPDPTYGTQNTGAVQ